jgi:pimeloyl-ACP methyl ester carboxylesterase
MMRLHGAWLERPWGRVRVWTSGHGPVVLALHGLGGSGRYWRGLADRLGDRVTIVAPDLPGFGSSETPAVEIDRALLLGDVDAIVARFGRDERVHVIGHSMGGVLAALWTASHRERVGSLALAAAPFPDGTAMDMRTRADLRPSPGRRGAARVARFVWPALAVPIGWTRGYPADVVIDFGRQSVRARAWTMWSLWSDPSLAAEMAAIGGLDGALPTLLAHARDDRTVSVKAFQGWTRLLPHAERHALIDGGHQFLLRRRFEPLTGWLARGTGDAA